MFCKQMSKYVFQAMRFILLFTLLGLCNTRLWICFQVGQIQAPAQRDQR